MARSHHRVKHVAGLKTWGILIALRAPSDRSARRKMEMDVAFAKRTRRRERRPPVGPAPAGPSPCFPTPPSDRWVTACHWKGMQKWKKGRGRKDWNERGEGAYSRSFKMALGRKENIFKDNDLIFVYPALRCFGFVKRSGFCWSSSRGIHLYWVALATYYSAFLQAYLSWVCSEWGAELCFLIVKPPWISLLSH